MKIVLDTCALIWWSLDPDQLSLQAQEYCAMMEIEKNGLVASISLWEIALKVKKRKLHLGIDINTYIQTLFLSDVIAILPIDVDLWLESVNLDWNHKDPVDRIVVALASKFQAPLITKDTIIKNFYSRTVW